MTPLKFELDNGTVVETTVRTLLNGGYAGRSQDDVRAHVRELAELGVPAPTETPALYPVSPYLAQQTGTVAAPHEHTSGEAEWALVVAGDRPEDLLLTVACDHTDRALEVHGVAWSKNAAPDVLGSRAWRLVDVADRIDDLTLTAWVGAEKADTEIQRGTLAELLPPRYWVGVLEERGLLRPGTVLLSGTIPMHGQVDQFAGAWRVELGDPSTGGALGVAYDVERLPEPIG
ncbi:hypothetical protein HDA32_001621 [Spinactinospora alkalitolerans]|uniref:DUF2848 domain-containing protein n=1 Tax=Spinactinospora alkalitolerans TaxID=687207 RepID=A0A852TSB6_9ACTN|nr:DUF2848 domain-containing protein [Spinactinospora alkalitolerans]NYE46501.1 hypothetical protein [Spinactinospora alkalitolerans]